LLDDKAVILIGPMGAGKSTIGRLLAARLHMPFIDLDERIVEEAGMNIPAIFASKGEKGFRELEMRALEAVCSSEPGVVATGGGIVLREANRVLLLRCGKVVWVDAAPAVVAERIWGDSNRPLLNGVDPFVKATELDGQRRPLYRELAALRVDTALLSAQQAVDAISTFLSESAHE